MTTLQEVDASVSPEVQMNENFETLSAAGLFGKRQPATSGLTWGFYGGIYNGATVADGTVTLTNAATNYIVVNRATGAVSVSTSTTNWDSGAYQRLYKVTTAGNVVTAVEDHRWNTNGLFGGLSPAGRQSLFVSAAQMRPSAAGGCAALATIATAANQPDISTLDFDSTTQEYAQFSIAMPKRWNEGTVTFVPIWSHPATATDFGVVWSLEGVAIGDDDPVAVNFGPAQKSTDTGGTTNDLYRAAESAAITIGGSPQAEDVVHFRVSRVTGDAADTMTVDARLHGLVLYFTTDQATDA